MTPRLYVLSRIEIVNGRYAEAVKLLKKALAILSSLFVARQRSQRTPHDLAIESYNKALKFKPNDFTRWQVWSVRTRRHREAKQIRTRAVGRARLHLGRSPCRHGR
jgi:tetratricopeptide (TPR) repeat protein